MSIIKSINKNLLKRCGKFVSVNNLKPTNIKSNFPLIVTVDYE